jgi:hypothetical protein
MPTQAESWIRNVKRIDSQEPVSISDEPMEQPSLLKIIKAKITDELINLSPFEQRALALPSYPAARLHQSKYGGGPFTKFLFDISALPSKAFVEFAGMSQRFSRGLGFSSDPEGVRGKIREASSAFILPALVLAAPVAVAGAKEGHKMYKEYNMQKRRKKKR